MSFKRIESETTLLLILLTAHCRIVETRKLMLELYIDLDVVIQHLQYFIVLLIRIFGQQSY